MVWPGRMMMVMRSVVFLCTALTYCHVTDARNGTSGNRVVVVSKNSTAVTSNAAPVMTATARPPSSSPGGLRLPCSCAEGQCGCCTGTILGQFNQKACMNITYEPDDFALTAAMSMNGKVLFKRSVSGKNPPPMCFRPPRFSFVRMCMTFSNVYFASRNIHFCVDMEANWEDITLVDWSFDCMRMGVSGVAVVGPEEGGGLPANPIDSEDQTDEDYDDSARNAPIRKPIICNANTGRIVFDSNLDEIADRTPDRSLIKIETLGNGDVRLSSNKLK